MKCPCNSINILIAFLGSYFTSNASLLSKLTNTVQIILEKTGERSLFFCVKIMILFSFFARIAPFFKVKSLIRTVDKIKTDSEHSGRKLQMEDHFEYSKDTPKTLYTVQMAHLYFCSKSLLKCSLKHL